MLVMNYRTYQRYRVLCKSIESCLRHLKFRLHSQFQLNVSHDITVPSKQICSESTIETLEKCMKCTLFYKQSFFNAALVFLNFFMNSAQFSCCLTHIYNDYYTETNFVFSILCLGLGLFVLDHCDLFFIFSLIFIVVNQMTSFKSLRLTLLFFYILQKIYYFWMITQIRKANNYQIAKVQPQGVAQRLLIFRQFQPGVAYKSVAYIKSVNVQI